MPTTIDKIKDQLKAAGVGKLVLWSAGRDLFPLAQALGEGEEIKVAVRGVMLQLYGQLETYGASGRTERSLSAAAVPRRMPPRAR